MLDARPLLFSVDSLDVRVGVHRSASFFLLHCADQWRAAQAAWVHGAENPSVDLAGIGQFQVLPGKRRYEFTLVNREIGDIRIWKPENWDGSMRALTGPLYVSFRSKFLLFHGVSGAYRILSRLVGLLVDDQAQQGLDPAPWFRVARVDLAVDMEMSRGLTHADTEVLVTRAQLVEAWNQLPDDLTTKAGGSPLDNREPRNTTTPGGGVGEGGSVAPPPPGPASDSYSDVSRIIARNRKIETVYVGRFGSAQYCRLYDKLKACQVQDKPYYHDLWKKEGWDGEKPVWRVEFSLSGEALKQFTYETQDDGFGSETRTLHQLKDLSRNIPRLWSFYTSHWLRSVDVESATRLERCDTLPWWEQVQQAVGLHSPAKRTKQRPQPVVKRLYAAARGYLASLTALLSGRTGDTREALDDVLVNLLDWSTSPEGVERVAAKRMSYATDDTTESALWRSDSAEQHQVVDFREVPDLDAIESAYWRRDRLAIGLGS